MNLPKYYYAKNKTIHPCPICGEMAEWDWDGYDGIWEYECTSCPTRGHVYAIGGDAPYPAQQEEETNTNNACKKLALLNPEGTKMERLKRLVECAKALGFVDAEIAAWNSDEPELGCEDIESDLEYHEVGSVQTYSIGIYCHANVHAVQRWAEDDSDLNTTIHDTREAAEAKENANEDAG